MSSIVSTAMTAMLKFWGGNEAVQNAGKYSDAIQSLTTFMTKVTDGLVRALEKQLLDKNLWQGDAAWLYSTYTLCKAIKMVTGVEILTLDGVLKEALNKDSGLSLDIRNQLTDHLNQLPQQRNPLWLTMFRFMRDNEELLRGITLPKKRELGTLLAEELAYAKTPSSDGSEKRRARFEDLITENISGQNLVGNYKRANITTNDNDQTKAKQLLEDKTSNLKSGIRSKLQSVVEYGYAVDMDSLQSAIEARVLGFGEKSFGVNSWARRLAQIERDTALNVACVYVEALLALVVHRPMVDWAYKRTPTPFHNDSTRDALRYMWPVTFGILHMGQVGLFAAWRSS